MVSKTDSGPALLIYRYYHAIQRRVAGSEEDLDRRFDKIIDSIERQKKKDARSKYANLPCISHLCSAVQRARRSTLGQATASGASAALAAKLTQYAQGWANLAVAAATGALTAVAVVAVIDVRSLKRSRRPRHQRSGEPVPSPHP